MEINIYLIAFIFSFIFLIALVIIGQKQNITYYLLMFVGILICNFGYYTVSISENLETAIYGNRLIYLGAIFVPILMSFSAMKLCHINIPKWFVCFIITWGLIVYYCAFNIGEKKGYYKNVYLESDNGMSYLIKEYGPMHKIYIFLLIFCVVITIGVTIYSIIMVKNASYRTAAYFLIAEISVVICYGMGRITKSQIDYFVIAYLLDEILILALINRIGMYDVAEIVAKSIDNHSAYGYLVFNKSKQYIACNEVAKEFLPEICEQRVDTVLSKKKDIFLYEKFGVWLENPNEYENECFIERDERVLKCVLTKIYREKSNKHIGYLVEIIDDTNQQKYIELINDYNAKLEQEIMEKTAHIGELQNSMILGMADMIENRDTNTGGHVKRTSEVIRIFTSELYKVKDEYGFSAEFLNYVVKAAPMHDLGKIAVDDNILRKPGKYTPEEYEEMKKHSEKGAEIVSQIMHSVADKQFVDIARNVAHYHHEKWDGSGYPKKLTGENIPLEARIMALADVFDALVSKRCYKEKMNYDTAFNIIEESLGSHFDPELGKLFMECRPLLEKFYDYVDD